jgi:hypothetical protein
MLKNVFLKILSKCFVLVLQLFNTDLSSEATSDDECALEARARSDVKMRDPNMKMIKQAIKKLIKT